jgi:hypothetical protein
MKLKKDASLIVFNSLQKLNTIQTTTNKLFDASLFDEEILGTYFRFDMKTSDLEKITYNL